MSTGTVEAIAASPNGPIQLVVEAHFDDTAHPSAVAVVASIDTTGNGRLRIVLDNVDPAAPAGTRTELDPTRLDADAVRVLAHLLAQGVNTATGGDPVVARVTGNLPGVVGLDTLLPPLPIHELFDDPIAVRTWLADIVSDPTTLRAWFTRLAGLLGSGLPAAAPTVTGSGTPASPLRAPLITIGTGSALSLTMSSDTPVSGVPRLRLGVGLTVEAPVARLETDLTILALPLGGTEPVAVVPDAHILLIAPATGNIVDQPPTLRVGSVAAGLSWNGVNLTPRLDVRDVVFNGTAFPIIDLTNANSVVAAGAGTVQAAIESAIGPSPVARAVLSLLGLRAPTSDPAWPHMLNLAAFASNPTAAIADVHRAAVADPTHGWDALFAELVAILGITTPVAGDGRPTDPWRIELAKTGVVALEITAWNARDASTPAGTELLRLGLRVVVSQAPWEGLWRTELLAFDLAPGGATAVRFLGGQHLSVSLATASAPSTGAGLSIASGAIAAGLDWTPGLDPTWRVGIENLTVSARGDSAGPLALGLPLNNLNPTAPDLGLGIGAQQTVDLFRLLLTEALFSWAGPAGVTIGALLGLHRGLRGLPSDWPVLQAPAGGLPAMARDPLSILGSYRDRVLNGVSADGTPFVLAALPWVRALLTGTLPPNPSATYPPAIPLRGGGTYDRPWTLPFLDERLELTLWLDPDGPPRVWWEAAAEQIRAARNGTALVSLAAGVAALVPEVALAIDGRFDQAPGLDLDALEQWLSSSDGVVPTAAQFPAGTSWTRGTTVLAAHEALPTFADAIAQARAAIDAWAGGSATSAPRTVLLISPPFSDHRAWAAYLQAADPTHSEDAHFDLRGAGDDAVRIAIESVAAASAHYTVDLRDSELSEQAAQIARVATRVAALTGRPTVYLVGFSTAGLAATIYAAVAPQSIGGVVTIGSPHGGSTLAPLVDPGLANAVRLANALDRPTNRTTTGRAVADLATALDRGREYSPTAFGGLEGAWPNVRGLAIPGQLSGLLVEDLATAVADRAAAAAAARRPPTHVGFGLRGRLDLGGSNPGDLQIEVAIRIDAKQVALGGSTDPAPHGAPVVHVQASVARNGGWLLGSAELEPGRRLRRMELGLALQADTAGNLTATPLLRLHDAGDTPSLDLPDIVAKLASLPAALPLSSPAPAAGTADALLVDLLVALGFVVPDGTGTLALALDELAATAAQPIDRLGPRVPALLDVVAAAAGLTRSAGPVWSLQLAGTPIELTIGATPWRIGVRTFDPATARPRCCWRRS